MGGRGRGKREAEEGETGRVCGIVCVVLFVCWRLYTMTLSMHKVEENGQEWHEGGGR